MPLAGDTLQRAGATVLETESRPGDQILHGARDKHLAGLSKGSDAGADVHGDPAELRAHHLALASVEAGPHGQAEALDAMLEEIGKPLDTVLFLDISDEEATKRLLGRASEEGRSDDTPAGIAHRLRLYHELTQPVVERYERSGALVLVDGERSIDEVFAAIEGVLEDERADG